MLGPELARLRSFTTGLLDVPVAFERLEILYKDVVLGAG
jgi:hypothetical protein